MPAHSVQAFRAQLATALDATDSKGRSWGDARWGCYAFYDFEGEPIYVGKTNERLRVRVRRHLTNQRTDAVGMGVLDVSEVAELELWPLWNLDEKARADVSAQQALAALEYSVYVALTSRSRFGVTFNEKGIPPTELVELPQSLRFPLVVGQQRVEQSHPDVRLARRALNLSRLAANVHERGAVSEGLRKALVVQAARFAFMAAERLAYTRGEPSPSESAIEMSELLASYPKARGGGT